MPNLDYRGSAQIELLGTLKRHFGGEFEKLPRTAADAEGGFFLNNGMFESVDAEILYAMIRWAKPKRIIEIGAGWSTLLATMALEKNAEDGSPGTLKTIDPVAPGFVYKRGLDLIIKPLQEVSSVFDDLKPGDMILADTSHVWVEGHEVDATLRAMEGLEGVYVHFHDIFLPNSYPPEWGSRGYDEQDHLVSFLYEHEGWEVLLGSAYLHQKDPGLLEATFPSYDRARAIPPGSFWIYKPIPEEAEAAQGPDPDAPHEFKSDRSGKRCLVCGKTVRAKVHA